MFVTFHIIIVNICGSFIAVKSITIKGSSAMCKRDKKDQCNMHKKIPFQ